MHFPSGSADPYTVNLIQLIRGLSMSEGVYTEGPKWSAVCQSTDPDLRSRCEPGCSLFHPSIPISFQRKPRHARKEGAMWTSQCVTLRGCLKYQNGAAHWRKDFCPSLHLGRYDGVHISGGMMECTSCDDACGGQCPAWQFKLCLNYLLQAPSYVPETAGWKNIAQDDTLERFSALYQCLRLKSIIRSTFLCLIFTKALSSKPSLKESWHNMWTQPLSGKA